MIDFHKNSSGPIVVSDDRILSRASCEALWKKIKLFAPKSGRTSFHLISTWNGEIRWARNQVYIASDRRNVRLTVSRHYGSAKGSSVINQLDDDSIKQAIATAEQEAYKRSLNNRPLDMPLPTVVEETPQTHIWSDATFQATAQARGQIASVLSSEAEAKGMLAAGYLEVGGRSVAAAGGGNWLDSGGWSGSSWSEEQYDPVHHDQLVYSFFTQAQCSMTVRHPQGKGSGWAGLSSFDWATINAEKLAKQALEKCLASINPVRIEPGRYTVILEPQAVATFVEILSATFIHRETVEDQGRGPWALGHDESLGIGRTKLGLQVIDERITVSHDPLDPQLGIVPVPGMRPITYIERGVLKTLPNDNRYAVNWLREHEAALSRSAIRMSGGTIAISEMISTTKRGLLVTRFSKTMILNPNIPLATGVTRDGIWLIENGKITKNVMNMRFTESPVFIFNQIEQLGVPVPVFHPETDWMKPVLSPYIVPPMKVKDFSFTSTVDAI
jgi:predicted Zn-dependent protease